MFAYRLDYCAKFNTISHTELAKWPSQGHMPQKTSNLEEKDRTTETCGAISYQLDARRVLGGRFKRGFTFNRLSWAFYFKGGFSKK